MSHRVAVTLLALWLTGCQSHDGSYTFAASRKLLDSDAPGVTKSAGAAFLAIPDALVSPLTTLLDASSQAAQQEGHIYLSYVGLRTLVDSDLHPAQKFAGGVFVFVVDTLWFPAALSLDVGHVLASDAQDAEPQDEVPQEQLAELESVSPAEPRAASEPAAAPMAFWGESRTRSSCP